MVLASVQYHQILGTIVHLVAINMVYFFPRIQRPTQMGLHGQMMGSSFPAIDSDVQITIAFNTTGTVSLRPTASQVAAASSLSAKKLSLIDGDLGAALATAAHTEAAPSSLNGQYRQSAKNLIHL